MEAEARKQLEDEVAKVADLEQKEIILSLADIYAEKVGAVRVNTVLTKLNEDLKALSDRMKAPAPPLLSHLIEDGKIVILDDGAPRWSFDSWPHARGLIRYLETIGEL